MSKFINNNNDSGRNDKTEVAIQPPAERQSIEGLIQDGQPHFGVFKSVQNINYLDYYSHLISQKPVARWLKEFKVNQFAFIQIVHAPYRVCLAVASIKLATTAFAYIYNEQTHIFDVVEAINPLTHKVDLTGDHQNGKMSFKISTITIDLHFTPQHVVVTLDSKLCILTAQLNRGDNPLAVCSPSGRRGWTFTQKEPFSSVTGKLVFKNDSKHSHQDIGVIEFNDRSTANLDWTLGFMRHETNWFWTCINTHLPDNRQFMLNLSMGVNETGVSENACWIDGEIHYLPPVMFRRSPISANESHDAGKTYKNEDWSISNQDLGWSNVSIDLTFTPISVYKKTDNYGPVASIFEQWIGHYSGEIQLGSEVIKIENVLGLAEDHFAKW